MLTRLKVPLLVLRPPAEMELDHARELAESLARHGHELFVLERGVHGSSMLVAERVGGPVEATWNSLLRFSVARRSRVCLRASVSVARHDRR
jgi:hypothetical protein